MFYFKGGLNTGTTYPFPIKVSSLGNGKYEITSDLDGRSGNKLEYSGEFVEYDKWEKLYKYRSVKKWYPGGVKRNDTPEYTTETFITCRKKLSDFSGGLKIDPNGLVEDTKIDITQTTTSYWTNETEYYTIVLSNDNPAKYDQKSSKITSSKNIAKTSILRGVKTDKKILACYDPSLLSESYAVDLDDKRFVYLDFKNGYVYATFESSSNQNWFAWIPASWLNIVGECWMENGRLISELKPCGGELIDTVWAKSLMDKDQKWIDQHVVFIWETISRSTEYKSEFTAKNPTYFEVNAEKAFIYNEPIESSDKLAYLVDGEHFFSSESKNGFVYTRVTNASLKEIRGWIRGVDITQEGEKKTNATIITADQQQIINTNKENLDFLIDYKGKYPYNVKLLENPALIKRMKKLLRESRFNFLKETWAVESPIEIENNIFTAEACEQHNCGATDFIIVYDFESDLLYIGIKEEYITRIYSESGETCQQIIDWRDDTKPIKFTQKGRKQLFTEEEKKSVYRVKTNKTFFYAESNFTKRENPYLGNGEIFIGTRSENGFVYTVAIDILGGQAKGWISTSDIVKIEGSELASYLQESKPIRSVYCVKVEKAFFYSNPYPDTKRNEYLVYGEIFYAPTNTNGFVYPEFTNASDMKSKGWIRLTDVDSLNVSEIETDQQESNVKQKTDEINNRARNSFGGTGKYITDTKNASRDISLGVENLESHKATSNSENKGSSGGEVNGVSFNLEERSSQSLPKPYYLGNDEGIVVVQITVNKAGQVTKAEAGIKGSNTVNRELITAAKKAALQARFNVNQNAPAFQTGIITYRFATNK